jgi:5'-3' exonuclease
MGSKGYIALVDLDSLIYKAVYKIYDIQQIKQFISKHGNNKALFMDRVKEKSKDRLTQMLLGILNEIEETGILIDTYEVYITVNSKCIRKKIYSEYKAGRKPNNYVRALRTEMKDNSTAKFSDYYEADDLIADRALILQVDKIDYVILSVDKDLKQIEGLHFDFFKVNNSDGTSTYRGLSNTSKYDSKYMLAYQMMVGDATDNIKGVPRIGDKKARAMLESVRHVHWIRNIMRMYVNAFGCDARTELLKNYRLVKLGSKLF